MQVVVLLLLYYYYYYYKTKLKQRERDKDVTSVADRFSDKINQILAILLVLLQSNVMQYCSGCRRFLFIAVVLQPSYPTRKQK
jgi:hypothetical protein